MSTLRHRADAIRAEVLISTPLTNCVSSLFSPKRCSLASAATYMSSSFSSNSAAFSSVFVSSLCALLTALAFDCLLRGQDWAQLHVGDVSSSVSADGSLEVSLLFGVRARGESVKTGSDQGVISSQFEKRDDPSVMRKKRNHPIPCIR